MSLNQRFTPFPGEVLEITGSFKRNPLASLSIPIPESFRLSSQSTQTGFPHPLQRAGCTFSDILIPNYLLRPDKLPVFQKLAEKKRKMAYALLPKGHLRTKAKDLIDLKRTAFEKNKGMFLKLHQELQHAILIAAGEDEAVIGEVLNGFYSHVEKQPHPYDYLATIHQMLDEICISSLYHRLQDEWLEKGNPDLRGPDSQKKYQNAVRLMQEELALRLEEISGMSIKDEVVKFMRLMGSILGTAAQAIILQAMSEKIGGFAPPMLRDIEQKLLCCTLKQEMDFIVELEGGIDDEMSDRMKNFLGGDIAIFRAESIDDVSSPAVDLVVGFEVYFNEHYYSTVKRD